eukprot:756063-Hanusia_phi.AAC.1
MVGGAGHGLQCPDLSLSRHSRTPYDLFIALEETTRKGGVAAAAVGSGAETAGTAGRGGGAAAAGGAVGSSRVNVSGRGAREREQHQHQHQHQQQYQHQHQHQHQERKWEAAGGEAGGGGQQGQHVEGGVHCREGWGTCERVQGNAHNEIIKIRLIVEGWAYEAGNPIPTLVQNLSGGTGLASDGHGQYSRYGIPGFRLVSLAWPARAPGPGPAHCPGSDPRRRLSLSLRPTSKNFNPRPARYYRTRRTVVVTEPAGPGLPAA